MAVCTLISRRVTSKPPLWLLPSMLLLRFLPSTKHVYHGYHYLASGRNRFTLDGIDDLSFIG